MIAANNTAFTMIFIIINLHNIAVTKKFPMGSETFNQLIPTSHLSDHG